MRRLLLALTITIVATLGVGISGGTALASNCTVTPKPPILLLYAFGMPTSWSCTDVVEVQFGEHAFRGGYYDDFNYACGSNCDLYRGGNGAYGTDTFTTRVDVINCPAGTTSAPYNWGHWTAFRIRGYVSGTWGSWHSTGLSAQTYLTCRSSP